jgi:triosephosphate isomerase (TIM)
MPKIRPLVAGNWKMNGFKASSAEVAKLKASLAEIAGGPVTEVLVCPPATLIAAFAGLAAGSPVAVGAQDCHVLASGAYTGDLSAEILADAGARAVIVGHSERRTYHGERDCDVKAKALAARRAGTTAIICVGETAGERALGLTLAVVGRQLKNSLPEGARAADTVIAYEPVWAIGTGLVPSNRDIAEVHDFIRAELATHLGAEEAGGVRILYGGSVKPSNAQEILSIANVDGALVGGASLKADDFLVIIRASEIAAKT